MKYAHSFVEAANACTITGLSEYFLIFVSSWLQFTNVSAFDNFQYIVHYIK
ncbi:hypothetical protein HOLleu_19771 [Holothuria leucospilota]|uniref:Uncharacterized protein n=1 Tax=Holothuria leucospilota TaxID=206669 RepID=A0A9Q1H7W7_HOLLE|nr:hypothetical protein HOLleu_19771 [Holothuria leucospilota]